MNHFIKITSFLKSLTFCFCLSVMTNPLLAGELHFQFEQGHEALQVELEGWLKEQFTDNQIAGDFLQDALKAGDITVIFTRNLDRPAHYEPDTRTIRIKSDTLIDAFTNKVATHKLMAKDDGKAASSSTSLMELCKIRDELYRLYSCDALNALIFELGNSLNDAVLKVKNPSYTDSKKYARAMKDTEVGTLDIIAHVYLYFYKQGLPMFLPVSPESRAAFLEEDDHFNHYKNTHEEYLLMEDIKVKFKALSQVIAGLKNQTLEQQQKSEFRTSVEELDGLALALYEKAEKRYHDLKNETLHSQFKLILSNIRETILDTSNSINNADINTILQNMQAFLVSVNLLNHN